MLTAVAAQGFARPGPGLNHILAYGQSLSTGWEGWPALSTIPVPGALMLGDSVRPLSESATVWDSVGGAHLRPLVATVQDIATGTMLSPAESAGLAEGDLVLGETVLEGAIAEWRSRSRTPPETHLLASACGVGGRSLEALSRGARPDLFNRLRSCIRTAGDVASRWGFEYRLLALLFLQGENNSWGMGGTADRAAYKDLLARFHADLSVDLAARTAGQTLPPAMLLYQTGGAYASADNAIAQAQLEVALELPHCFLAAPAYPVPDKGGHLDANGYRWLGAKFGKVLHRIFDLGEPWRPVYPLFAEQRGVHIRVAFHVPVPPLAWGRPFRGASRVEVANRGFSVEDAQGDVNVTGVTLHGPDSVTIKLERETGADTTLRYATNRHHGLGSLHDSDPAEAVTRFEGSGADVADLTGRPYALRNWCVAFAIPTRQAPAG